jgi:hypothetical protein
VIGVFTLSKTVRATPLVDFVGFGLADGKDTLCLGNSEISVKSA